MALLSKKAMNFTYGMGAAVVIIGALFKIQHYPGASALLIIGLWYILNWQEAKNLIKKQ